MAFRLARSGSSFKRVGQGLDHGQRIDNLIAYLFLQTLGYDIFNPEEVIPEYTADIGIKKGEKVDYCIMQTGVPSILVECKSIGEDLGKHGNQLRRYFNVTKAKFGLLTNGVIYQFYTDQEESNVMDMTPFLEIDLINLRDDQIEQVEKFCKGMFNSDEMFSAAGDLKLMSSLKSVLAKDFREPSDEFIKYLAGCIPLPGKKITQGIVERLRPLVKKSIGDTINAILNARVSTPSQEETQSHNSSKESITSTASEILDGSKMIITTPEEIAGFYLVRSALTDVIDVSRVTYRDTLGHFSVLPEDNRRKPICKLYLDGKKNYIGIMGEDGKDIKHELTRLEDITLHKDAMAYVVMGYDKKREEN